MIACLDETLRAFKGVPTYGLTDNEKTVTTGRVAGIALRHPEIVGASRHYGCVIHTCQSADPESKGRSAATVRIAKADIVPTTANLRDAYENSASSSAGLSSHREVCWPPARIFVATSPEFLVSASIWIPGFGEVKEE